MELTGQDFSPSRGGLGLETLLDILEICTLLISAALGPVVEGSDLPSCYAGLDFLLGHRCLRHLEQEGKSF